MEATNSSAGFPDKIQDALVQRARELLSGKGLLAPTGTTPADAPRLHASMRLTERRFMALPETMNRVLDPTLKGMMATLLFGFGKTAKAAPVGAAVDKFGQWVTVGIELAVME